MIDHILTVCDVDPGQYAPRTLDELQAGGTRALSRLITALENHTVAPEFRQQLLSQAKTRTRSGAGHHRHRRFRQIVADR